LFEKVFCPNGAYSEQTKSRLDVEKIMQPYNNKNSYYFYHYIYNYFDKYKYIFYIVMWRDSISKQNFKSVTCSV
jgi:hypothetical protein